MKNIITLIVLLVIGARVAQSQDSLVFDSGKIWIVKGAQRTPYPHKDFRYINLDNGNFQVFVSGVKPIWEGPLSTLRVQTGTTDIQKVIWLSSKIGDGVSITSQTTLSTIATNTGPKAGAFGTVMPTGQLITTSGVTITTTNCLKIILTNVGTLSTTFSYTGQTYTLAKGDQAVLYADWDFAKQVYAPYGALIVDGLTSSGGISIIKVFIQ